MIHGKFFAGLTPKMIDKSGGPDRQRSNLFWPDESDIESATEAKSKRRQKVAQQISVESNSSGPDVEPRELFKKQLTSKIEFYDMIDNGSIKSPVKNEQTPGNSKKFQTFSSKIEFYDYADDQVHMNLPQTDVNSKKDVERNTKNSPKTADKRIKFVDNSINNEFVPKGILRNNETVLKQKTNQDQLRKKLMKKKNLSKSVENLSSRSRDFSDSDAEENCVNIIENDVKNVTISDNFFHKEERKGNGPFSRGYAENKEFCEKYNHEDDGDTPEQIDENFYRKRDRDQTHVVYHHDIVSGRRDIGGLKQSQKSSFAPTQAKRNGWTVDKELNVRSGFDDGDDRFRKEKPANVQNSLTHERNQAPPDNPVNNRAHRHLVSNITFGSDNEGSNIRPTKNVRSSAVSRVSVGLPD